MRLFVAIDVPQEILGALDDVLAPAREAEAELAWTAANQRHITVEFLGDATSEQKEVLTHELDVATSSHSEFELNLGGFGAFPNFRRARVVWWGVEAGPRLELLHHDVACACMRAGFQLEARAFRPHITVARVRPNAEQEAVKNVLRTLRREKFRRSATVSEIVLYESVLNQGGSVYRKIHTSALRGR